MALFQTPVTLFYDRMSNMLRMELLHFLITDKDGASAANLDPKEFALIMELAQVAGVSDAEFMTQFNLSESFVRQLTLGTGLRKHPKQREIVLWLQKRLERVSALNLQMS